MEEVIQKYPMADSRKIQSLWQQYQYSDQKTYKNFLEFYEKNR